MRFLTAAIAAIVLVGWGTAMAQVMQSPSYKIQSDSVNFGGAYSESESYQLEDTLGEIATGRSTSESFELRAGYQEMHEIFLSLTQPGDVALSPAIGGITGGQSDGFTSATATTDNLAGYELSIRASDSPAMQGVAHGDTIDDYDPGAVPAYDVDINGHEAVLAYSPEGEDTASRFLNNASEVCGTGSLEDADACWDGLTTSDVAVAQRTSSNHPDGTQTVVKFRVKVGPGRNLIADEYMATTTLTLIAL